MDSDYQLRQGPINDFLLRYLHHKPIRIRRNNAEFGATAFGRKGIATVERSSAYDAFCIEMPTFFKTGKPTTKANVRPVTLESAPEKAREEAKERIAEMDQSPSTVA